MEENQAKIKKSQESQREVVETNLTAFQALEYRLGDTKIKNDCEMEIEQAKMELEKRNMDADMLRYEALQLAKKSFAGKRIDANVTTMAENDPTQAVLAGVLNTIGVTKAAIGQ